MSQGIYIQLFWVWTVIWLNRLSDRGLKSLAQVETNFVATNLLDEKIRIGSSLTSMAGCEN